MNRDGFSGGRRVSRQPRTERRPLTVDEVRALLRYTRSHRLHALVVVFALLGLRRSEALGLTWDAVDLDAGTLTISQTLHRSGSGLVLHAPKTRGSRRTVPLPAVVRDALRAHRDKQDTERAALGPKWPTSGYVFTTPVGTPMDPRNCTRLVQAQLKAAGLPVVRLHDLRHGCVTVLLGLGTPPRTVMEIVGHSTLEMTMTVYGHVSLEAMTAALEGLATAVDLDDDE